MAISWKRNAARAPAPAYLPAVAHRREIPYGRNENNRTRLPQNTCPQGLPAAPAKCPQGFPAVSRRSDRFRFREILTLRLRLRSE